MALVAGGIQTAVVPRFLSSSARLANCRQRLPSPGQFHSKYWNMTPRFNWPPGIGCREKGGAKVEDNTQRAPRERTIAGAQACPYHGRLARVDGARIPLVITFGTP